MDLEKILGSLDKPIKQYCFVPKNYQSIMKDNTTDELIKRINLYKDQAPRTYELLMNFFEINNKHQFLLEDWLLVIPYGWIWNNDQEAIRWFENNLSKLSPILWQNWLEEVIQKCPTANEICNRLYDYLVHLFAADYLRQNNYFDISFPFQEGNVDIIASQKDQSYAIESKRIKTSEKFTSLFWRANKVFRENGIFKRYVKHMHMLLNNNFNFPSGEKIINLSRMHCNAMWIFLYEIAKDPYVRHKGFLMQSDQSFLIFEYSPMLHLATTVESQIDRAVEDADFFFNVVVSKVLATALKQLNQIKYDGYNKIIFLGSQLDFFFSIDWTHKPIAERKKPFAEQFFAKHGVTLIYSEDVGFPIDRYL